ncbi:MAG: endo-1,4-beta-xylanase [Bacteroidales bacterium]|nr:endo-1,4-beta-xylanase [Bacteroidales bacterium]
MKKCILTLAATILVLTAFSCGKDDVVPSKYQGLTGHGSSGSGSGSNTGNNTGDNSGSTDTGDTTPVIDYTKYALGELAAQQGIKLGAAFTYWEYRNNPQVAEILTREFKAVTFGNEMKHDAIVQANGSMNFTTADQMAQWAKNAGTELFGHVLGWHSQQQTAYLNTLTSDPAAIDAAFKSYVFGMVEHFDVYAWDVVNETFSDGTNGAFRTQQTTQNGFVWGTYYPSTKDWVDAAFAYATEACAKYGKSPVLYINDYNLETDPGKRQALCNYAKNNPQVTGVASQMHLDIRTPDLKGKIEASLRDLVATGKMVRIAELDLKNNSDIDQADMFKYIFQKYLEIVPEAQRGGITFWGINDKDSWLGEDSHALLWKGGNYVQKESYRVLWQYLCELNGLNPYKE